MGDLIYEVETRRGKKRTIEQASMEYDIAFKDLQTSMYNFRAKNCEDDDKLLKELVRKGNLTAISPWLELQKKLLES